MKYLFFSPVVWDYYLLQEQELAQRFSLQEHSCIYVNPVRYKNWEKGSVRLRSLSQKNPGKVQVIERFSKLPKSVFLFCYESMDNVRQAIKWRPDAVVSYEHLMSLLLCIYCRLKGLRFVFVVTDDWEEVLSGKVLKLFYRFIAKPVLGRFSYAIVSTSDCQALNFLHYSENVHVVPNGKTMEFIRNQADRSDEAGHIFNASGKKTVNFISSLRDCYDFELLFAVFQELPELELNIYGEGELYESLLEKSAWYSNVHVKGNAGAELFSTLMSETVLGILPLKLNKLNDSTCPIKLFDYWTFKKPVVASPTAELKKIAGGAVHFATTRDEYLEAIRTILKNDTLNGPMVEKGYRNMIERYNFDVLTQQFENIVAFK